MAKGFNIRAWLGLDTKNFNKGIDKSKKETKGLASTFKKLGGMLAGVFAISKVIEFGKSVFELGSVAEGVRGAFDELDDPGLLDEMRTAVKGTISDFGLMQQAVTANEFNIPLEKMATTMQFASMQAQKMGGDVGQMAEDIIKGLARGSIPILDNLGLSAVELSKKAKITGDVTSAAFELINEKLAESGGVMETVAVKQARLNAKFANAKVAIFNYVKEGIEKITPALLSAVESTSSFAEKSIKKIKEIKQGWIDLYNSTQSFRAIVETIGFIFNVLGKTFSTVFSQIKTTLFTTGKALAFVFNPNNWGKGFHEGVQKILNEGGKEIISSSKDYAKSIADIYAKGNEDIKNGRIESEKETNETSIVNHKKTLDKKIEADKEYLAKVKKAKEDADKFLVKDIGFQVGAFFQQSGKEDEAALAPMTGDAPETEALFSLNEAMQESINMAQVLSSAFDILGDSITNAITGQDQAFAQITVGILGSISKIISGLMAEMVVALGVKGALAGGLPGLILGLAGVSIAKGLIMKSIAANTPGAENGMIVPGSSFSGDKTLIRTNSKEMILNQAQQANLFAMANGAGGSNGGAVEFEIRGDKLVGVLSNYNRKMSKVR